jgi:hypothetical protein
VKLQYAPHWTRPAGVVYPDFPVLAAGCSLDALLAAKLDDSLQLELQL